MNCSGTWLLAPKRYRAALLARRGRHRSEVGRALEGNLERLARLRGQLASVQGLHGARRVFLARERHKAVALHQNSGGKDTNKFPVCAAVNQECRVARP